MPIPAYSIAGMLGDDDWADEQTCTDERSTEPAPPRQTPAVTSSAGGPHLALEVVSEDVLRRMLLPVHSLVRSRQDGHSRVHAHGHVH
jgi:hypothetical protein